MNTNDQLLELDTWIACDRRLVIAIWQNPVLCQMCNYMS
jgi:hypothetical protein